MSGIDSGKALPIGGSGFEQLRQERDEWRQKALDVEAHPVVVLLRKERDEACAKLAASESHCATLRAALEKYSALDEQVSQCTEDEVNGHACEMAAESCGYCFPFADDARIAMRAALAATPADCAERLKAEAGRDRAVQELGTIAEELEQSGASGGQPVVVATKQFIAATIKSKANQIAKEGAAALGLEVPRA